MMTVSNVVRGASGVAPSTRERVLEHVEQLGYRPNVSARSLRASRSGMISLAVPSIDAPYFAAVARLVITEADQHGWTVLVRQTLGGRQEEQQVLEGRGPALVDGTIFFPNVLPAKDVAATPRRHPVVLLGDRAAGGGHDAVVVDNVAAAREATEHLIGLGRTRIAAIGVEHQRRSEMSKRRLAGYRSAIRAAGLDEWVPRVSNYSRAEGAAAMAELLAAPEPPDAVFCFADVLAIGAMYAAHEAGFRIPADVAIAGFDDIDDGRFAWPPLTSISPDKADIAGRAVAMLHERLSGEPEPEPRTVHAKHRLIVRGSTTGS